MNFFRVSCATSGFDSGILPVMGTGFIVKTPFHLSVVPVPAIPDPMPDILSHFGPENNGFGKITKIHKSIRIFNRNFVEKAVKACYDYETDDPPAECLRRLELSAYGD